MRTSIFVFALGALLAAGEVFAQAPRNFSYQGVLLDAAKHPVTGPHTITVKLYDTPFEGAAIHTESFTTTIDNGLFSVIIGAQTAFDASVTFNKQYWLGVSVDGSPELLPRTALTATPYANALTTGAVTSINNINGELNIVAGKGLNVVTNGNTITLNAQTGVGGKQDPQSDVVHSITGTENQVLVDGTFGTQIHDDLTLTLPQDIHDEATPTFAGMTLTDLTSGSSSDEVLVSNDGVLETRSITSISGLSGSNPFITFAEDEGDLDNNRVLTAGNGISITDDDEDDDGTLTVSNTGVLSITGTANQVNADVSTGDVTLSLPQDIDAGASPTFAGMTLTDFTAAGVVHNDGSGVLSSSEVVYGEIQDVTGERLLGNPFAGATTMSEISLGYGLEFNGTALQTYSFAMGNEPFLTFTADLGSLTDNRVLGNSDGSLTLTIGTNDDDAADIILNTAHANSWTALQTFSSVDINGGTIDGTTIGGAVPADGTFANLVVNGTSNLKGNISSSVDDLDITDDVEVTGSVDINTNLNVDGTSSLNGAVSSAVDDLDIADDVQITGNLNVNTNTDLDGTLNVDGAATHQSTLDQKGNLFSSVDDLDITDDVQITGNLNVNTNTDLDGTLNVDGAATHQSTLDQKGNLFSSVDDLDITDDVQITGSLNVNTNTDLDGTLNVDGAATHQSTLDQKGNLFSSVDDLDITDDVEITGSLDVNTNSNVDGNTTLNGNVNLGDAAIDAILLKGTLTGLGSGHALGTLGTDATVLTIKGDDFAGVNELDVQGDANISGMTTLGALTMNGDIDMNQHHILDLGNIQFTTAASNLTNTAGDVNVNDHLHVTLNTDLDGNLNVDGTSSLNGAVSSAVDDLDIADDVEITGSVDINTNLNVDGTSSLNGAVSSAVDDLDIADDVEITGSVDINTNLNVDGTSSLNGAVSSAVDDLDITDDVQITGNLNVNTNTDLDGTLNVDGAATHQSTLDQKGNLFSSVDDLDITDDVQITGNLNVNTNTDLDGTLNVDGAATHQSTLDQKGNLFSSVDDLDIADDVEITGSLDVNTNLNIDGTSSLNGAVSSATDDLDIADDVEITGSLDVNTNLNVDGSTIHVGTLDQRGAAANSTGNLWLNDEVDVTGSVVPTADNTYNLGSDIKRWKNAYVDGASVHIGPSGGTAASTEMAVSYAANIGSININGGTSELDITTATATMNTNLWLANNTNAARELRLYEASGSGTNYSAFRAQPQAADVTYTLPADDGGADDVMLTDGSGNLSWGQVTTAEIALNTILANDIATGAVESDEILNETITVNDIGPNAVGNSEMIDNAIGNAEMLDNAIGNAEMLDNAIGNAEMADNAIGNAEMADNAIGNAEMADNAIGNAEMADNAIGSNEIIDNSVTAADLADATISYADIQNVTNNRLLGRSNGSDGPMMEITIGAGLTLSGGQLSSQGNVLQGSDVTVVANAATVNADGITGIRVLSDNNPNSDALTITGGVNGQTLHIWYETTGNGDVVILGKTINVTNGGPGAGIILLKINGTWRLMGSFDN